MARKGLGSVSGQDRGGYRGGTGIGKAVALALAREGFSVVVAGRRQAVLDRVATETSAENLQIVPVAADIRNPESVSALFARTRERFGRVDLLFNNAGTNTAPAPLEDLTYEQWQSVVETNLTGAFLCTQEVFRLMKSQDPRGGRIINNGSISAHTPRPGSICYTATKHAMTGLTKSLSLDGRAFDIACGQIDIGNAATEMTQRFGRGVPQANGTLAAEPVFDARHVADAVLYMASLPLDANVQFLTITATKMPFIGRG